MQILGLHFDPPYLRCAAVEIKRKRIAVLSLKTLTPDDVKQQYISEWKGPIAAGLYAFIRHLEFKITSQKLIELGLPFQIETLTHSSLEELTYAAKTHLHKTGAESTVFLASKESLKNLLNKCSNQGVEPDVVTATPEALCQFCNFRAPALPSAFLVDLGSEEWTCIWMENGKLKKSFTIQSGIESLLFALWEDRKKVLLPKEVKGVAKQIDLLQLKPLLNPKLSEQLIDLKNKLGSVLYTFQQAGGVKPVVFTGRSDAFGNLAKYLLEIVPELSLFEVANVEESKHAMAVGFALAASKKEIQFLKGEFATKKSWRKAGLWGIGLSLASLCISIGFGYFGNRHFLSIRKDMADVLKGDPKLGTHLFAHGLDAGLTAALSAVQKYDVESPYLMTVPKVSEVISWICSHPLLEALRATGDTLELLDVNYRLVSFPRIGSLRDPYTAKVELEFKVKHPGSARKVHEALLQGDALVDPNREISWETLSESYRTSFYLKNRLFHD